MCSGCVCCNFLGMKKYQIKIHLDILLMTSLVMVTSRDPNPSSLTAVQELSKRQRSQERKNAQGMFFCLRGKFGVVIQHAKVA